MPFTKSTFDDLKTIIVDVFFATFCLDAEEPDDKRTTAEQFS